MTSSPEQLFEALCPSITISSFTMNELELRCSYQGDQEQASTEINAAAPGLVAASNQYIIHCAPFLFLGAEIDGQELIITLSPA